MVSTSNGDTKMKTNCITNRSGYEHVLKIGEEYEILDICEGIFAGDHYVTVGLENGKKATALLYRFDLSKEEADTYIKKA